MTAHGNCDHPSTKAARAACRRANKSHTPQQKTPKAKKTKESRKSYRAAKPDASSQVAEEIFNLNCELATMSSSAHALAMIRRDQIREALEAKEETITLKVPGHTEVRMSADLALHLLNSIQ